MRRVFWLFALSLSLKAGAQQETRLTLQQCIDSAVKNSIEVQQRAVLTDMADVNSSQSRLNLLPALNGNVNHGVNQGRSIDPFTNTYVNRTINFANYSLGSDVVLFNGFNLRNIVRQAQYNSRAANAEWQQSKEVVTLAVILAYLEVLSNEDLVQMARQQVRVTQQQVERLEKMNKEGAIAPPLLYDLSGQQKEGELNVVNAMGAWRNSLLRLTQLMNIPYNENIKLERADNVQLAAPYSASANDVFQRALDQMGIVKAAAYRKESAAFAIKAARGQLYPTLFLSGSVNSNYSSAAMQERLINTSEVSSSDYVVVNGVKAPVVVKQPTYAADRIPYTDQLNNNIFSGVGLGLRIPVFNSFQSRNRIKLAKLEYKNTVLVEENTRRQLKQDVELAHLNMTNAWDRYRIAQEQVAAYAESFRAAEVRFNAGVGTSVDYLLAKNNLDRANLTLIMARYDYILRTRILDYYNR